VYAQDCFPELRYTVFNIERYVVNLIKNYNILKMIYYHLKDRQVLLKYNLNLLTKIINLLKYIILWN